MIRAPASRWLVLLLAFVPAALAADSDKLSKISELEWARDVSVKSFLDDEDPAVRRVAARALGRIAAPGDEIATAESASIAALLLKRLAEEINRGVRSELIAALGQAGTREAVRELVRRTGRPSDREYADAPDDERLLAARALRLAAQESDRHALVSGLNSRDLWESALVIGVLEKRLHAAGTATIDTSTRAALMAPLALLTKMGGPDPHTNRRSGDGFYPLVYALSNMGDPQPDSRALLADVLDGDAVLDDTVNGDDTCAEAARGLARSARPGMEPPRALFRDWADARIVTEVVHALAKHKDSKKARARLVELLGSHPSFHARREAATALGVPGAGDEGPELAALEKALEDPYKTVRSNALVALAARAPAKALEAAKRFAKGDPAARMAAARAFAEVSAVASSTVGDEPVRLVTALAKDDPDHRVRMTALDAFGEHGADAAVLALARDRAAKDDDPGIFETATDLLLKKGGPDAEPALLAAYERTRDRHEFFEAREQIVSGLSEHGAKLTESGRKCIERAATDPDASVAAAAAKAAATLAGKPLPLAAPRPRKKPTVAPRDFGTKKPVLVFETSRGTFEVDLFPKIAPLHVANVVELAEKKFYDGLTWHRVVSDFVIQGGCPRGDGSGDPGYTIPDELSLEPFTRGTLGMPKTATKDTGGCQLFFTHTRTPHLEGRYTVFGRIRKGVEVIDLIEEGDTIDHVKVVLEPRFR